MSAALMVLAVVVAYIGGSMSATATDRRMWRDHGYCPTCDRLKDER